MVRIEELKEVLGIDLDDTTEDHYLENLIRRASFRISNECNRQLEYSELVEYFNCNNSDRLYLKNWPVWEILQLQEFNNQIGNYEDIITGFGDTIENSVYIYEGRNGGLIRLLKNYKFANGSSNNSGSDSNIRIKYFAGYKNISGKGTVSGKVGTADVSGEGTLFETEFRSGDRLVAGNSEYVVSEILSDIDLKLSRNIENSFSAENYRINNVPADLAEAVLMLAAGSYMIKKYNAYGMDEKSENILSVSYNKIQQVVENSNLTPNVKMKFMEFDLDRIIDSYRRINV